MMFILIVSCLVVQTSPIRACPHGNDPATCLECRPCMHGNPPQICEECVPELCEHGNDPPACGLHPCITCEHGNDPVSCLECHPAPEKKEPERKGPARKAPALPARGDAALVIACVRLPPQLLSSCLLSYRHSCCPHVYRHS